MKKRSYRCFVVSALALSLFGGLVEAQKPNNIIDEVIWVVGDEPILKSEVEIQRISAEMQGQRIDGDPYTVIPEQLAIQKLFLHQASIDSIIVTEADVMSDANYRINTLVERIGSEEKLEEYWNMSMKEIRRQVITNLIEANKVQQEQEKIIGDKKISPAEVRRYFKNMPKDSLPYIQPQVEVEILTQAPRVEPAELEKVKQDLLDYAKRVNDGETSFAALARLYSQDEGSARQGGELGFRGRGELVPEFSNVAFSLTDPNTVSKIVQTEYGFHIIQFISRKGDKVNVRHILRRPDVSDDALIKGTARLDSIAADIRDKKFTFEEAVLALSDDKDTRNNNGLMVNSDPSSMTQTSRFEMKDLPQEVAKVVDKMQVGEVSKAFTMINRNGQVTCAIVLLKNRIEGHQADITADFQALTEIVSAKKNEEKLVEWIRNKQKTTYISIKDEWKKKDFKYPGWIK